MPHSPNLQVNLGEADQETQDTVSVPLSLGGLGARSALWTSKAAKWASWADCLAMVSERVAGMLVDELEGPPSNVMSASSGLNSEGADRGVRL